MLFRPKPKKTGRKPTRRRKSVKSVRFNFFK